MSDQKTRPYRKRKRAEQEQATRERITEATVALHVSLGPAHTTVKAIAERAGVQRATVYRHFPDEQSLFDACSAHYYARHPMPNPHEWAAIAQPGERLERALADLYAWYGEAEELLFTSFRDAEAVPEATRAAFLAYVDAVHAVLLAGRPKRGRGQRRVAAAIGHAASFPTWRSLTREQGLDDAEAVALMAAMVEAAG
jgi:AcrR family transcriptional regulator